jgi:hypothetical protein
LGERLGDLKGVSGSSKDGSRKALDEGATS